MDFTRKRLSDGKHFVVCNVVDISAGDWIVGAVRSHFSSTAVIAMLEDAGEYRGLPELIVLANFVSLGTQDLTRWGQSRGVAVHENVMPPVLNTERMARRPIHERFTTISQVQRLVDKWRRASGRNEGHTVH